MYAADSSTTLRYIVIQVFLWDAIQEYLLNIQTLEQDVELFQNVYVSHKQSPLFSRKCPNLQLKR